MRIYKILAIVLLIMLLLSFAGCFNSTNEQSSNEYSEYPFIHMTNDGMFNANEEITWREALKMFEENYKAIYDQTEEKLDAPIVRGEFMDYMVKTYNNLPAIATKREPIAYTDIAGHQYESAINRMSGAGVIDGTFDMKFNPDGYMTRIEVVKFLWKIDNRSLDFRETGESFKDITEDHEYYKVVMNALCGK